MTISGKTGATIQTGDILTLDRAGLFVPIAPYTPTERRIRRLGALLRWRRLARYHERKPLGVALYNAEPGGRVAAVTFGGI